MVFAVYSPMPKVSSKKFFAEQSAHSRVKADIVFKYVTTWATVMLNPKFNQKGEAADRRSMGTKPSKTVRETRC